MTDLFVVADDEKAKKEREATLLKRLHLKLESFHFFTLFSRVVHSQIGRPMTIRIMRLKVQ